MHKSHLEILVKIQFLTQWVSLRVCISSKFPCGANASGRNLSYEFWSTQSIINRSAENILIFLNFWHIILHIPQFSFRLQTVKSSRFKESPLQSITPTFFLFLSFTSHLHFAWATNLMLHYSNLPHTSNSIWICNSSWKCSNTLFFSWFHS